MTYEKVEEAVKAIVSDEPWLRGSQELEEFRQKLIGTIDTKECGGYRVEFKGRSYRWLAPGLHPVLRGEVDAETGRATFIVNTSWNNVCGYA
jgi:hypothetical protein